MNRKQKATTKAAIQKSFSKHVLTDKVSAAVVLQSVEEDAKPLLKKLANFKIESNEDYEKASVIMKQLKDLYKVAEEKEDTILNPLKAATKATRELFKPFYDKVTRTQITVKDSMLKWLEKQELAKVKLSEKVASGEIKKETTVIRKEQELTVTSSASSVRKIPKLVCIDAALTPREYLLPQEGAIKMAILAGIEVPGWRVDMVNNIAI